MAKDKSSKTQRSGNISSKLMHNALEWRNIGPHRGGRVVAVSGDVNDPMVYYFGGVGGVWKTSDAGTSWENVSDGYINSSAVGAIAVSESDSRVVYAGMGESCAAVPRLHWTSNADGMYRSTDSGNTWKNIGLCDTRHIARIRIHPNDYNIVYVAVPGHFEGPHTERGVFRSKDGGENWERVLFRSEQAGAIDLSMDPNNPRILYASMWDFRRHFWNSYNGGPDSSIYKSEDGGDTWKELTKNPGLPKCDLGRVGVAASPAKADRVYALIQDTEGGGGIEIKPGSLGGLYRSDDGGANWEHLSNDGRLIGRPHYYVHVFPDPQDADTVYVMDRNFLRSIDGGRNFEVRPSTHKDNHDLWMDPNDSRRMINGNDGGACVSFNSGDSWSTIHNQPTGEFYHLDVDNQFPYRVYGTQQDNTAISTPSRSSNEGILWNESYQVGSSESGHIVVRPDNPNIIFSGAIGSSPGAGGTMIRYDKHSEQSRLVTVWPDSMTYTFEERRYRFQWDSPLAISPHDPNILYAAGNVIFRSIDEGTNWEVISPDLTRNDMAEREENIPETTIAPYERCTIFRLAESVHKPGVLWAGSDDGLVHISQDAGKRWENITPSELPEWSMVSGLELSPHENGTAFIAATAYQHGDYRPFLFKTKDFGKTWKKIVSGINDTDFTRVIREDPVRSGFLYVGTENGVYFSSNEGASWQPLKFNLPPVPVHDMAVKDGELILATHGRGFWILDELSLLHQMADLEGDPGIHIFKPRETYRLIRQPSMWAGADPGPEKQFELTLGTAATYVLTETVDGKKDYRFIDAGHNPPDGVVVRYFLDHLPKGEISITFTDPNGDHVATFQSDDVSEDPERAIPSLKPWPTRQLGHNNFVWDLRHPVASELEEVKLSHAYKEPFGALAVPGIYQVTITIEGKSYSQQFEILKDPRILASQRELQAQLDMQKTIRAKVNEVNEAVNHLRSIHNQVDQWERRAVSSPGLEVVVEKAKELKAKLTLAEDGMIKRRDNGVFTGNQVLGSLRIPGPAGRLSKLTETIGLADGVPTNQSYEVFDDLRQQIDPKLKHYRELLDTDVEIFVSLLHELEVPEIDTEVRSE